MTVKIAHLCPVTAAACLLLLLSSCVFDRESCPPVEGSGAYSLSIRIGAQALATRAANHGEEPASKAEDFIDVTGGDYCVYLLDGDGRVKQRFVPTAMTLAPGSDHVYNLTGDFIPEMDRMQVMVLANWGGSFGGEYGYDLIGRSLEDLYAGDGDLIFTYPVDDDTADGSKSSWMPSESAKEGIPMFGLSDVFDVKKEELKKNGYKVTDKEVKMLRSLSKVEVTNQAVDEDGNDPDGHKIEIVSCRLTGYNTTGRFIPDLRGDNAEWDKDQTDGTGTKTGTRQVVSPSMPKNSRVDYEESALYFGGSDASFTAYVPEMVLPTNDSRPRIEVILKIDEDEHDPYYIELADYKDGAPVPDGGYEALLRNHHYQFNITSVTVGVTGELTLLIDTDKWDNDDDTYYYDDLEVKFAEPSDNDGRDGKFKWQWDRDNIYIDDPAFNNLSWKFNNSWNRENIEDWPNDILAKWVGKNLAVQQSDESGAIATFNITAPERGSWTLALYPDDGTPNHWFYIELWDPEKEEWVSEDQRADPDNDHNEVYDTMTGTIAAKGEKPSDEKPSEVKIKITASQLQYTGEVYSARLVMNVTTFDGRMAEVNLVTGELMTSDKTDDDYYRIIQIATPTN